MTITTTDIKVLAAELKRAIIDSPDIRHLLKEAVSEALTPRKLWTKSQREAYDMYGEAEVKKLLENGKLQIKRTGVRNIQYYVPDLEKHLLPKSIILNKNGNKRPTS